MSRGISILCFMFKSFCIFQCIISIWSLVKPQSPGIHRKGENTTDKLIAVMVLLVVSALLIICAVYLSLDSLRYKANAQFKRIRPQLTSWSESVLALFDGLDGYKMSSKTITVSEINRLCSYINEKLASLSKSGYDTENLSKSFSDICGAIFNDVFYYNEAVIAYNKKLSIPLCKAVAQLLKIKSPEMISELFFQ